MGTPYDAGWGNPYHLTGADMTRVDIGEGVRVAVRNVDVGTIFRELVRRLMAAGWDGPSDPTPDDWGYNGRLKRWAQAAGQEWGSAPMSSVSDHAWGTGLDLDTLANPMLTRRPADIWAHCNLPRNTAAIALSLGLDWGGNWSEPWDPQHFGITETPAQVARRAAAIRADAITERGLSIVDAETKTYLDRQFTALTGVLETVIYGDERTDKSPDTHPENLQRIRQELAAFRTAFTTAAVSEASRDAVLAAAVDALRAGGGTVDLDALRAAMREAAELGAADALRRLDFIVTEPAQPAA